jgi:hypothetical protein
MSKDGKNTLDVAGLIVNLTAGMGSHELEKFERALCQTLPVAIEKAAEIARAQTKPKPKSGTK